MAVITIQELQEAAIDAGTVEAFSNGVPAMVTPRYGVPFPNMPKLIETFENEFEEFLEGTAYEIPVPYAAGISVTRMTQTFTYLGELYRPKAGSIPFTTTVWATDSAKFVANGDASLRQDLGNASDVTKSSAMVGHYDPVAPAFLPTVSDILNMLPVNVLRLVPKSERSALHAGTGSYPLAAPLNSLIHDMNAAGGGKIDLTYGKHKIEGYVEFLSNVTMEGLGDNSLIEGMFASPINRMITSPAAVLQSNIKLRNFKMNRAVVNTQHGILTGGIDGLTIEGVHISGAMMTVDSGAMGISAFDGFAQIQSKNVNVRRCTITRCNNFGIAYGNVSGGSIEANEFYDCWREAIGLEAWGNGVVSGGNPLGTLGVVEGVHAVRNNLRMSSDPANHYVGSVGPAILIGGATSNGKVVGNTCAENTIIIVNPGGVVNYHGISITGSPTQETSGNVVSDNVVIGAPGSAIAMGALGQITKDNVISDNIGINCGTASASGVISVRATSGNLITDNKAVGTTHAWMIDEQTGADSNVFLDNLSTGHNQAYAKLNGPNSILRDPRVGQFAGGIIAAEVLAIVNDASADTRVRGTAVNRTLCFISSNLGGNYALLLLNSTSAPTVISKSIDVAVGATDPGTAAALSVFPVSSTAIRLTNRLGSDRSFSVTIIGVA